MIKVTTTSVCLISVCAAAAFAQSEQDEGTHEHWGETGGWTIKVDPSVGNGCYMDKTLEDGTLVQVGFVPDQNGGFFAAYNAAWTDIEDGVAGTIQFDFVHSLFEGEYVGAIKGDRHGAYAFFNNPEFTKEFSKRNTLSIKGDGEDAFTLSLSGTSKAMNAVRNCDAEQSR